jgi:hypothetical protein
LDPPTTVPHRQAAGAACFGAMFSLKRISMQDVLFPDPEALASICRKHRIRRLSVFGSALKGRRGPTAISTCALNSSPTASPA